MRETRSDVVVVGSGFGGAMAARTLLEAGYGVRILERGPWLDRREPAAPRGPRDLDAFFDSPVPHRLGRGGNGVVPDDQANVGGPSVFFAAVSSRFRAADFDPAPEIVGDSGASWPITYADLEPYYAEAEAALGVAGPEAGGATEPPRSRPYAQPLPPLSETARRLDGAARRLGYTPFRLPLAINYQHGHGRRSCESCAFCDGFPCLIGAKNDVASRILPPLLERGLELEPSTIATRLLRRGRRIVAVEARDASTGERSRHHADLHVLAAGSLASPGLVLVSGLQRVNRAGDLVGRFLTRHCNAHVFGLFWNRPDSTREFHKQLGIDDFYFGDPRGKGPAGKLGMIQQMATPWVAVVLAPRALAPVARPLVEHMTGFIVMAEDQPRRENRVVMDGLARTGAPRTRVLYEHSPRDLAARAALIRRAKEILREAGSRAHVVVPLNTFSHAMGTLRMGADPATSVVDPGCRFRGLDNLYVVDGSVMPTAAGVNPSLTIAAAAIRTARGIAAGPRARAAGSGSSAHGTAPDGDALQGAPR